MQPYTVFLACHILTGACGLLLFWGTMLTRKGSPTHRRVGRAFAVSMLATGTFAAGMAVSTLIAPPPGHHGFEDAAEIRGVFGWMMLYLAWLTVSLAWHAWTVLRNRRDHRANRALGNLAVQLGVIAAAVSCAVHGYALQSALMQGVAVVGVASGVSNLVFMLRRSPARLDYLREHIKAGVGAGISVYTAFLAFGMVRLAPELALNPLVWSAPTLIGVTLIAVHIFRLGRSDKGGFWPGRPSGPGPSAPPAGLGL